MNRSLIMASFFFTLLCWFSLIKAQAPGVMWTHTFGFQEYDLAYGAFELPSGDFLVGGYQQDTSTYDYAGWIFRLDANGNFVTEHHTGFDDLDETLYCMCPAPDYTFVLTGSAEHPTSGLELYAVKTDTNTHILQANRLGSNHIGYGVTALPSGQCVFVGELMTTPNQGFLVWTFPDLSYMFQNIYGESFARLEFYSINQTLDSCLILTGPVEINPFESRFFYLIKLDSAANCIGNQFYGFGGDDQIPYWVEPTLDGGYIICGYTTVGGMLNDRDLYIVKVDSFLNLEWTKRYPQSEGRMIIRHPGGGYVLTGNDRGPGGLKALIMRLDENGDSLWTKKLTGAGGNSISLTADGGYIIAGFTPYTTERKNDAFVARLAAEPVNLSPGEQTTPDIFMLYQNYPNPFNPTTAITWQLPKTGFITVKIYDITSREITTLVSEKLNAGKHEVLFDASPFSSGIYFYQIRMDDFVQTKKMIFFK
jgi:hypothetical protein